MVAGGGNVMTHGLHGEAWDRRNFWGLQSIHPLKTGYRMKVRFVVWKIISRLQNYCNHSFDVIMITMIPCLKVKCFFFLRRKSQEKDLRKKIYGYEALNNTERARLWKVWGKVWLQNIFGTCREGAWNVYFDVFWLAEVFLILNLLWFIILYPSISFAFPSTA